MFTKPLPRNVITKQLAHGATGFYFNVPTLYRKQGCKLPNEPLGTNYVDACGENGEGGRAASLNALFNEWHAERRGEVLENKLVRYGTVDWLFREYKSSKAYLEKVSLRSRGDYERVMQMICGTPTKKGDVIGGRSILSITPRAADKIYDRVINGPNGERLRQGEKAVNLASKAWRVVQRLHPTLFLRDTPDPWKGVTLKRRVKLTKAAVSREEVYAFAWGCIERGQPEPAAAAVICFEWLQRPENVLAGFIRWTDYRSRDHSDQIRIEHHKTGKSVLHPLQEETEEGVLRFYEDAEAVLAKLPRRGIPMILRELKPPKHRPDERPSSKLFSRSGFEKIIQRMRAATGAPAHFTLDACRHGGMTELEEAELTDGQGRALSAHSSKAYDGYAKRTLVRALAATRKRHAHVMADKMRTDIQNEGRKGIQNEVKKDKAAEQ